MPLKYLFRLLLCIVFSIGLSAQEKESWFKENFISKEDGAVDLSVYLDNAVGIIPMPIIITEPAVGFGGGLSLVYFHRRKKNAQGEVQKGLPPSLSTIAGAYTANGTYVILGAHQGSYLNDFLRYTGAIGHPSVNLKFFGDASLGARAGLDFNLQGFLVFQEFLTRVKKDLPLFLGFNYIYFGNKVKFNIGDQEIDPDLITDTNTAGINFVAAFDRRDNIFTPNRGGFAAIDFGIHDQALGGSRNYNNFAFRGYYYLDFINRVVLGLRYNFHYKWGDVPFFELPFINLRGIPALRYQGNMVNTAEVEARINVYKRWSVMGFAGTGTATDNFAAINADSFKSIIGTGFRYELARDYGLHMGVDFAFGPEQFAWYLTFGSNWFR